MLPRRFVAITATVAILAFGSLASGAPPEAVTAQDAESAKHGYEAARYGIVDTLEYPGFEIVQFDLPVLSHYSYLLASDGKCLVVDPGRDVTAYVDACEERGWTIEAVYLTHSHADFVAGHSELAGRLGALIYVSAKAGADYEHEPIEEGDSITVGRAVLTFLETPGHTPDGTCALVASGDSPDEPRALFSGDTLFIGSVGRPDLLGEGMAASSLASMMYDTWYGKLSKLPDHVQVFPAHGAGSLCGAHLSDEPTSTLGEQRAANPYFRYTDRGQFIASILEGLPDAPQYFRHNAEINRIGPDAVDWDLKELPTAEPDAALMDPARHYVADIRDAAAYAAGHIPNSVNIGVRGRFETWIGAMVPWGAELVLCGDNEADLREAVRRLHRVGYDAKCVLLDEWAAADQPLATNEMVKPRDLHAALSTEDSPVIVDVRLPSEWMALRVAATANLPLNELDKKAITLDRSQPLVTVCNSAYRSSMAVGVLQRLGFENVSNMEGGGKAWIAAGLPVLQTKAPGTVAAPPKREVRLAERLSPAELKRLLMDMPGSFELVDIRPAEHFGDYHLPGAVNVDLAEVLDNPAYLTGVGPLIVVDRDGSVAMMVAGVLSQKTERSIKALYGGLQAYWSEADYGAFAQPLPSGVPPPVGASSGAQPAPPRPSPAKPKKRSAGC